jgi:hypothetical protein
VIEGFVPVAPALPSRLPDVVVTTQPAFEEPLEEEDMVLFEPAPREAPVLGQPLLHPAKDVALHDHGHGHFNPFALGRWVTLHVGALRLASSADGRTFSVLRVRL